MQKTNCLARHSNSVGLEIKGTTAHHIIAANGERYLDFTAGWCVGNLGWGRPEIKQALRRYNGPDYVSPAFAYKPWSDLAGMLCSLAPGKMQKCYRATGGTEAVDIAMQLAMMATGRKKFVSLEDSYHGNSLGTLSIGASSERENYPRLLDGCIKIKGSLNGNRLDRVETALRKKDVAAFLLEPVQLNLGVQIPDRSFMKGLQKLCRKYGTLLIADEVACGFGRTGKLFACEHYDLQPDILCLAKALSGGYAPIGAVLTTNAIHRKVKEDLSVYSTYGWHPLSVAAALATVNYFGSNRKELLQNVADRSQQLRTALSQMNFRKGGRLNIIGLAIAIDAGDEKYAASIKQKCHRNRMLVTTQENKVVLFPPLTITRNITNEAIRILEKAV